MSNQGDNAQWQEDVGGEQVLNGEGASGRAGRGPGEGQRNTQELGQDDPAGDLSGLEGTTPPRGGMSEEVGDLDDADEGDLDQDDEEEISDGSLPGRMGGGLAGA